MIEISVISLSLFQISQYNRSFWEEMYT